MLPVPVSARNAKVAVVPSMIPRAPGAAVAHHAPPDPAGPALRARHGHLGRPDPVQRLIFRAREYHNSALFGRTTIHTPQDVCADHTARPRLPACDQLSTPGGACSVRGTPHTVVVSHHGPLTPRLLGPDLWWSSFCDPQSFPDQYLLHGFA